MKISELKPLTEIPRIMPESGLYMTVFSKEALKESNFKRPVGTFYVGDIICFPKTEREVQIVYLEESPSIRLYTHLVVVRNTYYVNYFPIYLLRHMGCCSNKCGEVTKDAVKIGDDKDLIKFMLGKKIYVSEVLKEIGKYGSELSLNAVIWNYCKE